MASVTDIYPLNWQLGVAVLITTQPIKDSGGNVIPPASVLAYITELQTNLAAANAALATANVSLGTQTALLAAANQTIATQTANITTIKSTINTAMPSILAAMNNGQTHKAPAGTPADLMEPTVPGRIFNSRLVNKLNEVMLL